MTGDPLYDKGSPVRQGIPCLTGDPLYDRGSPVIQLKFRWPARLYKSMGPLKIQEKYKKKRRA